MRRLVGIVALGVLGAWAPAAGAQDWTTFGGNPDRAGIVAGAPAPHGLARVFARRLDGQIYAQPLFYRGRVYIATENNSVYAFSRSGHQLFRRHFGEPVHSTDLPCGNIVPITGITGTPVIAGRRLYTVAYLRAGHRHVLFGIDAASGRTAVRADVSPPKIIVSQERGALLYAHGRIYIPYGGLDADCGDYHGYVLSVTTAGHGLLTYTNPSPEAGIWGSGGVSEEASGNLLAATGNGASGDRYQYDSSVLRLSPGLNRIAYWAPANWAFLSDNDTDVGSITPLPLPGGRVFQGGKDGLGYVLPSSLGGIGGELFSAPICKGSYGAAAFSMPYIVVPCIDALVGLRLDGNRFTVVWRAPGQSGPPLIAGGAAVAVDRKSGRVRALRLSDGQPLADAALGQGASSFPAVAGSGGLLAAPAGRTLVVYRGL